MRETNREIAACVVGAVSLLLFALGPAVIAELIAAIQRLAYSYPP